MNEEKKRNPEEQGDKEKGHGSQRRLPAMQQAGAGRRAYKCRLPVVRVGQRQS